MRFIALVTVLTGFMFTVNITLAANMADSYYYAWSDNYGYINFENVSVTDNELSGSAWSKNAGFIDFSPSNGGISNDGSGNLSGSAWGEGLGWIDFSNISIDPETGVFSGTATGEQIGTLTFDCLTYCDVRTVWRGQTGDDTGDGNNGGSSGGNGDEDLPSGDDEGGGGDEDNTGDTAPDEDVIDVFDISVSSAEDADYAVDVAQTNDESAVSSSERIDRFFRDREGTAALNVPTGPDHVESYNTPLTVLPEQTGLLVWEFPQDEGAYAAVIEVPRLATSDTLTFFVTLDPGEDVAVLHGTASGVFEVTARDSAGNEVTSFNKPLVITLFTPQDITPEVRVSVYSQDTPSDEWQQVPDVNVNKEESSVTFTLDHLTRLGMFIEQDFVAVQERNSFYVFGFVLVLVLLFFGVSLYRRRKVQKHR